MTINEWFDTHDINHVRAYEQLQINGQWPEGFIPDGLEFEQGWIGILHTQFTVAWIEYMKALCS